MTNNVKELAIEKHNDHFAMFHREVQSLLPKSKTWMQRRDVLAFEKRLQLIEVNNPPNISHFF